jgi:hypothetical protein
MTPLSVTGLHVLPLGAAILLGTAILSLWIVKVQAARQLETIGDVLSAEATLSTAVETAPAFGSAGPDLISPRSGDAE